MAEATVGRSSAVMAAGTLVSRLSGYVRSILLAAALGASLHADVFNIANTIPNMLYILLAGGMVNAVLVPQLVRSLKHDEDGGAAYTDRIITLAGTFLAVVTVLLVVAAPWVMRLFLSSHWSPEARDSAVMFARFCLPQVFFYGMFVLVGQVLNARGRFGPMMWAPIANNVIAVGTLIAYLVIFGADDKTSPTFSDGRILLLGLGSTLGIAAQCAVLVPYLRAAGVHFRPRFDFRGTGLSHTLRLGVWTVLFVIANQLAYTVVVRLASGGTAGASAHGTGYTVYSATFLIVMVPHSIVTVSLAAALLPRLSARAADGDLSGVARQLGPTLRQALAIVVPFAVLLPLIAHDVAQIVWGYGAAAHSVGNYVPTLAVWGPGLVLFTIHFLVLRGFYAIEENRTVFFIQCAVAVTNVVVALLLVSHTSARDTAPALVVAYTASYLVGAVISYSILRRRLGGLFTSGLVRFAVRLLLVVAAAAAVAGAVAWLLSGVRIGHGVHALVVSLVEAALVGGSGLLVVLALARVVRLREITGITDAVTSRLRSATISRRGSRGRG